MTEQTEGTPEGEAEATLTPDSAETEQQEQVETSETESEPEDKPRKPTAKDRIDELTRLRREAERDAEYWRAKALEAPKAQEPAPVPAKAEGRPDPSAYDAGEFDPRYVEDLTDWKAETAAAKAIAALKAETKTSQVETEWKAREARAIESLPDYEDKVILGAQRNAWACTAEMGEAIRAAEKGPELAYELASNPAEAARISRLSRPLQLMELGKLEAKLTAPKAKTATTAPTPPTTVRGSGGQFAVQPDTNDFAAFEKQYGG